MTTHFFAQTILSIATAAISNAPRSPAIQPIVALRRHWQGKIERRRLAEDLHAMSNRALNDIGIDRSAIDWIAYRRR